MAEIISPKELKSLCEKYNLSPSKKYGQNYLVSQAPITKMIAAANLKEGEVVFEIGPGFGVLTKPLLETGSQVVAFEIEQKLKEYWQEIEKKNENLQIVWGNVLFTLAEHSCRFPNYKVVANLPYQITSSVLQFLLELPNPPSLIVVMVQKEVAERICAEAGEMSLLSVAVRYYGNPKIITFVPGGSFWPAPKVDSAALLIDGLDQRKRCPEKDKKFFRLAKAGFLHKRKQLYKNLMGILKIEPTIIKEKLNKVMGSTTVRAEELSIADWCRLFEELETNI